MKAENAAIYEFGGFRLDAGKRLLQRADGEIVPLTPKVFETLLYLVRHSGKIVEKDELLNAVWADTIVEENNLNQNISALRKIFGEKRGEHRFIATVPGQGYKFVADVRELVEEGKKERKGEEETKEVEFARISFEADENPRIQIRNSKSKGFPLAFDERLEKSLPPDAEKAPDEVRIQPNGSADGFVPQIENHKFGFLIGVLILSLAAVVFGYWFFGNQSTKQIESIAVLPFVNESGNVDAEYLSDGITESLIGSLSQLPSLSVKARSSVFRYKGKEIDPKKIGQELSVQAVLLGRVIQRGEQLILNLELVDVKSENVIWSEQYARKQTDLVSLQTEIVRDVSSKLRMRLSGAEQQRLVKNYTENSEAYRLYLKGRYYWYKFPAKEYKKSGDYYQQAIDVDPNYALAYAGLAEYYGFGAANGVLPGNDENWSKSESAVNKALALDDALPDAYNALAGVKEFNNDRAGAERDLKRAIELNPNYAEGYHHYAYLLTENGRFEEAIIQMNKALELEPFNVRFNLHLAWMFYRAREFDRSIEQCRKTLELDPNDTLTHQLLGDAYEQKGMQKEAVAEWSRALTLSGNNELAMMLERAFATSDFKAAVRGLWRKKLERFNEQAERGEYVPAMNYAFAYTRLADKEQALAWLAKAEQERNTLIFDAGFDPVYDIWRDDSRFQDLLKRIDKMKG